MKKLLFLASFMSIMTNAQTVIFSQTEAATNGIVSTMLSNGSNAVWAADDFEVTSPYQLTKIRVFGFQNDGNFVDIVQGFNFYIYTNDAGKPSGDPTNADGTAILSFTTEDLDSPNIEFFQEGGTVEMVLTLTGLPAVNLAANTKYWLVCAPKMNLEAYTGAARFNWYAAAAAAGSSVDSQLIDPFGAFGTAAPDWTSCVTLTNTPAFVSLAFEMEGTVLSSETNELMSSIQAYPNPVSDVLNIQLKNTFENVSYELVDINGRKLYAGQNESINMAGYNAGVYVLNILQDGAQVGSQKIIKK
jgi:hypothetical protein